MSQVVPFIGAAIGFVVGGPAGAQLGFMAGSNIGTTITAPINLQPFEPTGQAPHKESHDDPERLP